MKKGFRHALAVVLSILLMTNNMGTAVFADDFSGGLDSNVPVNEEELTASGDYFEDFAPDVKEASGGDRTVNDEITTWGELQTAIGSDGTVTLTRDIIGGTEDSALNIPSGVTVTLNLNGYTIDRGLAGESGDFGGSVIDNSGKLTLNGPGTITGGNTTYTGGGVRINSRATLNMNDVTVTGNRAQDNSSSPNNNQGGGVYVGGNATFNMNGGSIAGNYSTGNGSGVLVLNNSTFNISGSVNITGNIRPIFDSFHNAWIEQINNVYLGKSAIINVTGDISGASVGVTAKSKDDPITNGLNGKGGADSFSSDNEDYSIALNDSGEAVFSIVTGRHTITIDSGITYGTVSPNKYKAGAGDTVTLTLTPEDGYMPDTLSYSYQPDGEEAATETLPVSPDEETGMYTASFTMPDAPVTVTATFQTAWRALQKALSDGDSVRLTTDAAAGSDDGPLVVPKGKTVTLDLNGHAIDRGLTSATADGYVIRNEGTLTITDESSAQTGMITGGWNDEPEPVFVLTNTGGGVYNTGTLRLEGGAITGNKAKDNAGVLNSDSGTFTMTGGTISNNTSYLYGGAGVTNVGTFTMTGGMISGNSAVTRGGGVWSIGSFTMTGGTISGNTAGDNGGGVCIRAGGAAISGGTISGNSATGTTGAEAATDDTAPVTGCGGGLYMDNGADVTLSGGSITGNTAQNHGGDVYLDINENSWNPILRMKGNPVADDLYLAEGKVIIVDGAFTEGADITVSTAAGDGEFTSGYSENNEAGPYRFFRASDPLKGILLSNGEAAIGTGIVYDVSYVDRSWDGTKVVSETKTRDVVAVPSDGSMTSGWYYLNSDVTRKGHVESITGDVNLILGDGYTLSVKGLYVPAGSTLTIYGQSDGDSAGKIISRPSGGAGIGGYSGHDNGNIVICGGTIDAAGYDHCAGIGSNDGRSGGAITIYGGTVTAEGGSDGAAIGGGRNCSGGTITIYGGDITANGPTDSDTCENGAGIGGGNKGDGGNIAIYGGTVTAYSRDGAGIGGGDDGDGGNITISGGTVTSTKVNQGQGARIGGGCDAAPGTIIISGGTITTDGGYGAGIGGGRRNTAGGSVTINGGVISASGSYGIGSGEDGSDVAVTLDYTDGTKDTISITASSYGGTVTLEKPFVRYTGSAGQYLSNTFSPGTFDDTSLLGGGILKAYDIVIFNWQSLQMAIDGAPGGTTITLTQNVFADYTMDTALLVAEDKDITIDLNGCTIDRGLTDRDADVYGNEGYVIKNKGTLTITDSAGGGMITGGNCRGDAGGILNIGTLTMNGGSITGNQATGSGGGIHNTGTLTLSGGSITGNGAANYHGGGIYNGGTLTLNGGSITGNTAGQQGGGVLNNGTMNVSGAPVVSGNTAASGNNIYLRAAHPTMTVTGELAEGADLYVTLAGGTGTITGGYGGANGTAYPGAFFHADAANLVVALEDGEAVLADHGAYAPTVIIRSANVEFDGVIRLHFTFSFPADVLADEGASVTFEKAGTTTSKPVSEGTPSGEYMRFTIPVPAPEYADDITIRAYDGGGGLLALKSAKGTDFTEDGFVYSVRTYAQNMSRNGSTEEMRSLAKALDDYGTAAQIYFAYGDCSGLSVDSAVTSVTAEDLAPYALTTSGKKPAGVTGAGIAVRFESDNTLRITFRTDGSRPIGGYTFLIDDAETTPAVSGKNAMLEVVNIAAPNLDTPHTFAISDGTDTYTVTASALSYAYTSVKNGNADRQNLGKALYLYNQAANTKFGS